MGVTGAKPTHAPDFWGHLAADAASQGRALPWASQLEAETDRARL